MQPCTTESIQQAGFNDDMDLDDDSPPLAVADYGALPTDVLHDILLRLPADELCRLRLVCRSWRSLTSDPLFARAHSSRHPPHAVVLHHRSNEVVVVELQAGCRIVKRIPIGHGQSRREAFTTHGDLVSVSHGWGLAYVLNLATGAVVADVAVESRSKVNAERPTCVLGHVPSTGEYKLLRIQSCYGYGYHYGDCLTKSQPCEVMTLGGGGRRSRRWRKIPSPPVFISSGPMSCWSMAVVAGVAYFLLKPQGEMEPADSIAVFDMATEVWKPTTIQGPSSSIILAATMPTSTGQEELMGPISRRNFRLARLDERLVTVYCNLEDCSTELWFLVDMEESLWTKIYTLQGTHFGSEFLLHYHYPLMVLEDGRLVVWVERTGALRAYDPRTSTWGDLAWMDGDVVMHHGSLLCPNLGVQP